MDLEEYKNVIRGRFNELSDEEKTIASDAADSPVGDVIRKLFRELLESTDEDSKGGAIISEEDYRDLQKRAPYRPFKGPGPGAIISEEDYKNRFKRDNKPVGDQMKTLLGTR